MNKTYTELTYVICHNGSNVVHPAKVLPGTTLASGQPQFEEFTDEAAWKARLAELKYDVSRLEPPTLPKLDENGKPIAATPEEMKARMAQFAGSPADRPAGPLTAEQRKARREERMAQRETLMKLSPEDRQAKRQELRAQRLQGRFPGAGSSPAVTPTPAPSADPAPAPATPAQN